MPTPADELRAAAKRLRETATNATPGPWSLLSYQIAGVYNEAADTVTDVAFTNGNTPNARWIALASPALAEPLAELLEETADWWDDFDLVPESDNPTLVLARAITGSTS